MRRVLALLLAGGLAAAALAHQPVIVGKKPVTIRNPEISRAFYDELTGKPRSYFLKSAKPFMLYLNLLVPRNTNPTGRYSAIVFLLQEDKKTVVAQLLADSATWRGYYESFGADDYLKGPELRQPMLSGDYEIEVYCGNNRGKYVLVVGEKEFWGPVEIFSVYANLPRLKWTFFGTNPLTFFITPFGFALLFVIGGLIVYLIIR